jgi:hypothetical protein
VPTEAIAGKGWEMVGCMCVHLSLEVGSCGLSMARHLPVPSSCSSRPDQTICLLFYKHHYQQPSIKQGAKKGGP